MAELFGIDAETLETVKNLAAIATLIALALAVWQIRQARKFTDSFELIRDSLSTRYIGAFPKHIPTITKLIESAKEEVIILCDLPAYGQFSSPLDSHAYGAAIKDRIAHNKRVEITYLDEKLCDEHLKEQFADRREAWDTWIAKKENKSRVEKAIAEADVALPGGAVTSDLFLKARAKEHKRYASEIFRGARIERAVNHIDIYLWIVDASSAVIAFPSVVDVPSDHAFLTSDPRLIKALMDIRSRYRTKK